MKKLFVAAMVAGLCMLNPFAFAADDAATPAEEVGKLISTIQDKLENGKKAESDFTDELKQFDALFAKYKKDKPDEAAQILAVKSSLYLQVFDDTQKGVALLKQIKSDFPESKTAQQADHLIAMVEKQEESKKIQRALAPGSKFPDFSEKDMDGKALSISNYKGKVVLVDFWATWCPPCRAELPNVIKTYQKHHSEGFEVIGISLDDNEQKLANFLKDRNMPWPQYFDGKGWGNKLAAKYGITSIPATFLLDGEGKIIAKDIRGDELEVAVVKALAKK